MKTDIKRGNIILDVIIIALCASAVFLFCRAVFFDTDGVSGGLKGFLSSDTPSSGFVYIGDSNSLAVSNPLYTLVTQEGGSHYAEKYNFDEKYDLINMFSTIFAEALGSAGSCEQLSEAEWQEALKSTGVFLDYVFPQSLAYLSKGLGTVCSDSLKDIIAHRFILSVDGNKLCLCYANEDGDFYRCRTASSVSSLSSKIAECPIGIAQFAFELGDKYENLDPYFIFTNENFNVADIIAENPINSTLADKSLLNCFGINESASSHSTETDGSTLYVEGDKSLRFDSDGRLFFTVSSVDGISTAESVSNPTIEDVLTACGAITKNVFSHFGSETVLGVTDISGSLTPSDCSVSFGQFIDGIPVTLNGDADIATYKISGGSIVRIEINLRSYTLSKLSSTIPLPEKQTAALVGETGGSPVLIYVDDNGSTHVSWKTFT